MSDMIQIDPQLLSAINEIDELRKTRTDHMQVPRVEGELLHQIALAVNAKVIVEVGTSYGFSGLWWAAALKRTGGKLHTIDASEKKYESARATFARLGLAGIITNHLGDGQKVLATISGPVDLAFIDADKPATRAYFDLLWPQIRRGGSVLVDNITTHREQMSDFLKYVRSRSDAVSTEIGVGNGIEWTIKTA